MAQTVDMRGILVANSGSPIYASNYRLGNRPTVGSWQFAKAQQYTAKIPLYPIYPRPTGEVNSFAAHLWAHSTMPYELKPCASFGCWPHRWSLTAAPAGMTIGGELTRTSVDGLVKHTIGSSYQKIEYAGTKPSSFTVGIKCEDNLLNEVNYSYIVTRDDTKFFFVDPNAANDSGDGTISSPKKFFSSAWTVGNAGKTIVLRAGTHVCTETGDAVNIGFNKSNRPTAIMGYPGETVIVTGSFWRSGGIAGSADDLVVRNIKVINYGVPGDITHVFKFDGVQNRVHFEGVNFDNIASGNPIVGDNQSCISFRDSGGEHTNISIIDCSLLSSVEISLFIIFRCNHVLLERPSALDVNMPDSNGAGLFNIKDQSDNICVRGDFWRGTMALGAVPCLISNQNAPGNNIEHCWYTTIHPNGVAIYWNQQRTSAGGSNQFDYAGSIRTTNSDCMLFAKYGASDLLVVNEGVAGHGNALYGSPSDGVTGGAVGNQLLTSGQIDATTGALIGTGTTYRLTRGAECWSNP